MNLRDRLGLDDVIESKNHAVSDEQLREAVRRFSKFADIEKVFFTPDEIQAALDKDLVAGLRQLADAIEAGMIEGKCLDCRGHGLGRAGDDRAHLMLRVDLAAPIRQTRKLEGE